MAPRVCFHFFCRGHSQALESARDSVTSNAVSASIDRLHGSAEDAQVLFETLRRYGPSFAQKNLTNLDD
jgi:hypothetical protein